MTGLARKVVISLLAIQMFEFSFAFKTAFHSSRQFNNPKATFLAATEENSSTSPPFQLQNIDHIVLRCQNFSAMFDFYHRIIGCVIDDPEEDHVNRFSGALTHLRTGSCYIDLLVYDSNHIGEEGRDMVARSHAGGAGIQGGKGIDSVEFSAETSTLDHLCIRVEPFDEQQLREYMEKNNVPIVTYGGERLGADGIGPSLYVRDPEGNVVELKGAPYQKRSQHKLDRSEHQPSTNIQDKLSVEKSVENADTGRNGITPRDGDRKVKYTAAQPQQPSPDADAQAMQTRSPTSSNDPETSGVPLTPCIRICRYKSSFFDGQVCIGCFREAYEIGKWQSMTPLEKSTALLDAIDRYSEANHRDSAFDGSVTEEELSRQYEHWIQVAEGQAD